MGTIKPGTGSLYVHSLGQIKTQIVSQTFAAICYAVLGLEKIPMIMQFFNVPDCQVKQILKTAKESWYHFCAFMETE